MIDDLDSLIEYHREQIRRLQALERPAGPDESEED